MALLEVNWNPSNRDLRGFSVVQLVAAGIVGWLLHRRLGWDAAAIAVLAVSAVGMIIGLARPKVMHSLYVAWMAAAFPIGWVMSHVALALVYYGVVTPIGVYLRWRGRDSLQLHRPADVNTYWVTRPDPPELSRYFRQF